MASHIFLCISMLSHISRHAVVPNLLTPDFAERPDKLALHRQGLPKFVGSNSYLTSPKFRHPVF